MTESKQGTVSISPRALLTAAAIAAALALYGLYLVPRYGGLGHYLMDGSAAGSFVGQTEGNRDKIESALSLYYSDSDGKYPPSLEALQPKDYLESPMPREDVFIEVSSGKFKRAHWRRDSDKVKLFASRADSDDGGGWGYVADPNSPEWGTVFVNCTHNHFKKGVPWNLSSAVAVRPASPQSASDPAQQSPGGETLQGTASQSASF